MRWGKFFGDGFQHFHRLNFVIVIFVVVIVFCVGEGNALDTKEFQKNLPAKIVWGYPGKNVELPCDVTPPLPNDNVSMIFWFKDNLGMPLYSLDARGGPLTQASHLAMSDDLGTRSYFITDDQPSKARLSITNVTIHDEGVFRCRVDFINSPTRNFQVNLTLVVQPSAPRVFDAEGREVKLNSTAGPFLEGHELFLSCQVNGGRPRPTLTWWHNGTILDAVVDSSRASSTTVNQLTIKVSRALRGTKLECRATSSEIAGDIVREIPIMVFLKPNKVKIVTPNNLLSVRKSQNIRCETSGSYPPAKLTWLLDGKPIRNAPVTEEETESFTGSIIPLKVVAEDDGKDLVCRADNPRFPGGFAEDRRQIHVAYPPRVSVKMDSGMAPPVKEGEDITLRCETAARPSPHSYSWYHDGHLVPYNESGGILPMDHLLVLRNIKQKSQGQYACAALNSEGETYSAPFELTIQYPPRCRKGFEIMRVATLPDRNIVAQCHVDAIPPVTRFSWTYNTSKGVLPVQGAKMQNKGDVSILHFTPTMPTDLESVSCWASNSVGSQRIPCHFYIVPAEKPEPPKNCIVRNGSHGGVEVSCIAGEDGGLHQSFWLEVSDISIPHLPPGVTTLSDQGAIPAPLYRVQGERPIFRLHGLEVGREYQVMVYSENDKGRSEPPVLLPNVRVETELPPETLQENNDAGGGSSDTTTRPTFEKGSGGGLTLILVGLTASAVLLIVGIVSVATVIACRRPSVVRRRQRTAASSKPAAEDLELSEAGFGEVFHRRSAQYRASMYALQETEDRISRLIEGPDLIMAPVSISAQNADY